MSRRDVRHEAARAEILAAAWSTVREQGLAGLSLRELGGRVGMKAQSLYSYFPSKHAIYDAMVREGYEAFLRELPLAVPDADVRESAVAGAYHFFDFCTADVARYQLLFQRTIPGFEPSPESWAVATEVYERTVGQLRRHGFTDQASLDLWTAVMTGLVDQQISNDPGGTRWRDLVERAVDALLADQHRRDLAATAPTVRTGRNQP